MKASGAGAGRAKGALLLGSTVGLMAALWVLLVAGTRLHEMLVGVAVIIASIAFMALVHRSSTLKMEFRARDVVELWRVPGYILLDCWVVTKVLLRDVFLGKRTRTLYRVCGFKTSKTDPVLVARRVLMTISTSASPNSIVIGIDFTQSRILFHQLQRSETTTMARRLGAEA